QRGYGCHHCGCKRKIFRTPHQRRWWWYLTIYLHYRRDHFYYPDFRRRQGRAIHEPPRLARLGRSCYFPYRRRLGNRWRRRMERRGWRRLRWLRGRKFWWWWCEWRVVGDLRF